MRSTPAAARVSTIWSATVRVMIFYLARWMVLMAIVNSSRNGTRDRRARSPLERYARFPSSRLLQRSMPIVDMKNESLAPDVSNHRRIMRTVDLAPKPAHMHVHEVALWNEFILPHLSEKYFARKYLALATHHILEQA